MANENRLNREEDDQQGNRAGQQGNRPGQQSGQSGQNYGQSGQQSGDQQRRNPGNSSEDEQDKGGERKSA
jgi:hypothetical protein